MRRSDSFQAFMTTQSTISQVCIYDERESNAVNRDLYIHDGCNIDINDTDLCPSNKLAYGKRNCHDKWEGKDIQRNRRWGITDISGDILTESNSLDKLTLDSNDNIIAATSSDISSGRFFERIDLYLAYDLDYMTIIASNGGRAGTSSANFNFNQRASQSPNTWDFSETFTLVETMKYIIDKTTMTSLSLDNILVGKTEAVSPKVELDTFKNSLYPVIQSNHCVQCHKSQSPRFAVDNALEAMSTIKAKNLANFNNLTDSFRGVSGGIIHRCERINDGKTCDGVKSEFLNAIDDWGKLIESESTGDDFRALTDRERIPGRASYEFRVTESGYYNIWFRNKRRGQKRFDTPTQLSYQLETLNGNPIAPIKNLTSDTTVEYLASCQTIKLENGGWKWMTPSRGDFDGSQLSAAQRELLQLDPKGKRLIDNQKELLPLSDNRTYYYLVNNQKYRLNLYEIEKPGIYIDIIAINKVFGAMNGAPVISVESKALDFAIEDANKLLDFQPDKREVDYANISDYRRHVLKYDLSSYLNLPAGEKASFSVEVRKEFDGQNYAFRNPRLDYQNDRNKSLYAKNISILINGKAAFTDKTFSQIDGYYGQNRVITYAPMTTLNTEAADLDKFSFGFEQLGIDDKMHSELYPAGEPPKDPVERECLELELFARTVKPILKNVSVAPVTTIRGRGISQAMANNYPGSPGRAGGATGIYKCMSCHNENHPYFKMTTFEGNDDQLCRQAISRVDFEKFYESLMVRGINGTNNHPKFFFVEELIFADYSNKKLGYKIHDEKDDYLKGYLINDPTTGNASKAIQSTFMTYKKEDFGFGVNTTWNSLTTEQDRENARKIGKFKSIRFIRLPKILTEEDNTNYYNGYYAPTVGDFIGNGIRGEGDRVGPNIEPIPLPSTAHFTVDGLLKQTLFPIVQSRRSGRAGLAMYYDPNNLDPVTGPGVARFNYFSEENPMGNGVSAAIDYQKAGQGENSKIARPIRIDYQDGNGYVPVDSQQEHMFGKSEILRAQYRETVIRWIRAEYNAWKAQNEAE